MARAIRCWWAESRRRRSSATFEMNAVSTSIDGMSGDLSTMNPACLTLGPCTLPTRRSDASTLSAASTLLLTASFCVTSSSTDASTSFLSSSDTPPIRSAAFSRSASQREASSDAPRNESTYTDEPLTLRFGTESACTEMNMSAPSSRALRTRPRNEMK